MGQAKMVFGESGPGVLPTFAAAVVGSPRMMMLEAMEILPAKEYVPAGKKTTPPLLFARASACAAAKACCNEKEAGKERKRKINRVIDTTNGTSTS